MGDQTQHNGDALMQEYLSDLEERDSEDWDVAEHLARTAAKLRRALSRQDVEIGKVLNNGIDDARGRVESQASILRRLEHRRKIIDEVLQVVERDLSGRLDEARREREERILRRTMWATWAAALVGAGGLVQGAVAALQMLGILPTR